MNELEGLRKLLDKERVAPIGKDLSLVMQKKLKKSGIYFRIFARVKEAGSVYQKLEWKKKEYLEKNKKMQDLVGLRIVLYYMDDIAVCKEMLQNTFAIIEKDSHEDIPKVNEFNPLRMNYVCRMPKRVRRPFSKRALGELQD